MDSVIGAKHFWTSVDDRPRSPRRSSRSASRTSCMPRRAACAGGPGAAEQEEVAAVSALMNGTVPVFARFAVLRRSMGLRTAWALWTG